MKGFLAWLLDYKPFSNADVVVSTVVAIEPRMLGIEIALAEMEQAHKQEIAELRERLDMPQKRKSSGRTFQQLRAVAEAGERAARERT